MASNKTYTVIKDGKEIDKLKTLTAAKKLADAEFAEVFSDGKCVYSADVSDSTGQKEEDTVDVEAPVEEDKNIVTAEPVVAKKPTQPKTEDVPTEKYRLKKLMNIRRKPHIEAPLAAVKPAGTVVRVIKIEDDWLHLADGNFVLYNGGEFAEKIEE